jgi:uncharacterized membrane protein YphA (DoxX/SURF4 family)
MMRHLPLLARLYAGAIMLIYGIGKLADPVIFLKSIHTYEILPDSMPFLLNFAAVGLPWLEIIAGLALLSNRLRRGAASLSLLSLLLFTGAILMRSLDLMEMEGTAFMDLSFDCGCGSGVVVIWQKMIFNGSLILATSIALFPIKPDSQSPATAPA